MSTLVSFREKVSMIGNGLLLANLTIKPTFLSQILDEQMKDVQCDLYKRRMMSGKVTNFNVGKDGVLRFMGRMYVPTSNNLRKELLREAHQRPFHLHPKGVKMYRDLKSSY